MLKNNLNILVSHLRAIFERAAIEKKPHHSGAMPQFFLNRYVRIRPQS